MAWWSIGRAPDNDIVLSDSSVSRRHAELRDLGGGLYELFDAGSSNGTLVRGRDGWKRIERAEVHPRDTVRLGDFETTVTKLLDATGPAGAGGKYGNDRRAPRRGVVAASIDAGLGALDAIVPPLSSGLLRAAGIACFALGGVSLVLVGLAVAGSGLAAAVSLFQALIGLVWLFVLLVLKKQLNQAAGFAAANLPIDLVAIGQVVLSAVQVLFAVLGSVGVVAAPGAPGAMTGGIGVFTILMLLISIAYGGLLIWMGIMLLQAKEQFGGLFQAFAVLVIVTGALFASIILTMIGALGLMATWTVLGILMLRWAKQRR